MFTFKSVCLNIAVLMTLAFIFIIWIFNFVYYQGP